MLQCASFYVIWGHSREAFCLRVPLHEAWSVQPDARYNRFRHRRPTHALSSDTLFTEVAAKDPFLQAVPDSVFLLENIDVYGRKKYVDFLTFKAYDAVEDTELHLDQGNHTYLVRDYLKEKGYDVDLTRYDGVIPADTKYK